jgi:chromosome segregation protein
MHLGDVHIEGFKSFSEDTTMGFEPGIGVIMGNNGVGKSNILDAIVWALGENDIGRLRCYTDDELFFSGSKKYPPAERIKVDLSINENASKDSSVVHFSREMSRNGRHRFRFEGNVVNPDQFSRELESHHLLHALKTIIRQEEINDILQLHPIKRFSAIQSLLEIGTKADLARCIRKLIAPLFYRYMSYLMPLAKVRMDVISQNGKRGLEVEVTLPGNRVRRAHQLSGGEKAITSLALKLAVFHQLESLFYLLDEVEPSLDYTNHKSIQAFLKDVASDKQLIMITHLRTTIELADTLHGVRTRFDGSSFMKFYFVMNKRLLRLYKCC